MARKASIVKTDRRTHAPPGIDAFVAASYFGYVFRGGQGNPVVADFMPIFWSYGADMFNADRTKVTIDTPEGATAMKTFMALRDVSPKGVESYNANEVGQALAAGTAASSINWPNWVATFEDPSQSKMVGKIS